MKKILLGLITYIVIMYDLHLIGNETAFFIVGLTLYFLLNVMTIKIELTEKTLLRDDPSMDWFMAFTIGCPMYILGWAGAITQSKQECHYHIDKF